MKFSVLPTLTKEQAEQKQFELVECISRHFTGSEVLTAGDYGVTQYEGMPVRTKKVERVMADFFGVPDCILVRGAGTGGIRLSLSACVEPGDSVLFHDAPMYTTTKETIRLMGINPIMVNYHHPMSIKKELSKVKVVYIQHSRQQMEDHYNLKEVISFIKEIDPSKIIMVDDNYTALKVPMIGAQLGADISTFSGFKILGPEGIGMIVGNEKIISVIRKRNYSGGGQVQGPEAMELLRSLVNAPILLAIQGEQTAQIVQRMNDGEINGIESAQLSNSQSLNVIAKLKEPIAKEVIKACDQFGASIYPVGAESKYEILPMVYRVSGSFLESAPELGDYLLRINPMRSGASLVIDILQKAIKEVKGN